MAQARTLDARESIDSYLNDVSQEQAPLVINPCRQTPFIESSAARSISSEDDLGGLEHSADVASLQEGIRKFEVKDKQLIGLLDNMNKTFARQCKPLEDERQLIAEEKQKLSDELVAKRVPPPLYPPAPGPRELKFVDSAWFGTVCNTVVVLNLLCMIFANRLRAYHSILYVLDQLFLTWYVFEMLAKWKYHRCDLFWGKISVVWWNWLDALIVVSGVVDQWVMLLVHNFVPFQSAANFTGMRVLRLLRLFRLMRFWQVAQAVVQSDMSWTERASFHWLMSSVIAVNTVVLGLELDIDWPGWNWFEHVFLIIYSFELFVRLKYCGWRFFVNSDFAWNNLDFFLVCGGVLERWLLPALCLIEAEMYGKASKSKIDLANSLKTFRIARIVRVLRLGRFLKMVRPLHCLLIGVVEALAAMQWVGVLTMLVLYAGAIVFTSLIGHGLIYSSTADIPPEAESFFGSIPTSLFSLFMLMNGDTSVVEPITKDLKGQLLFAAFMVLSNWAVLAILTSVVSDNMISSSQKVAQEEKEKETQDRLNSRNIYLKRLLKRVDNDIDAHLTKAEWDAMLADPTLREELRGASGLDEDTLHDAFSFLASESLEGEEQVRYEDFITFVNHDHDLADRRQVLHLSYLMKRRIVKLGDMTERKFEDLERMLEKVMLAVSDKNHPQGSSFSNNPESVTLSRINNLENVTQQKLQLLQGILEKVMSTVNQKSHPQGPSVANDVEKTTLSRLGKLEEVTQHKFEVLEGMLEKVMSTVNDKNPPQSVLIPNEVEKTLLSRTGRLEEVTQHKFQVLEGMLEKVMSAVNAKNPPQDPPVLYEVAKSTFSRLCRLEDVTQHKFEVFEGMLKEVVHAGSQKSHRDPLHL